jgi:hypothetical protein
MNTLYIGIIIANHVFVFPGVRLTISSGPLVGFANYEKVLDYLSKIDAKECFKICAHFHIQIRI